MGRINTDTKNKENRSEIHKCLHTNLQNIVFLPQPLFQPIKQNSSYMEHFSYILSPKYFRFNVPLLCTSLWNNKQDTELVYNEGTHLRNMSTLWNVPFLFILGDRAILTTVN